MNEQNDSVQPDGNETATTSLQPMSFVDILDGMFTLYRSNFQLFFRIIVVYLVLGFATNIISASAGISTDPMTDPMTAIMITVLTTLVGSLVVFVIVAGMAYLSAQIYLGRDITSQAALQQALHRFFPLLGCSLLYYLVLIGLSITIIGIPFAIYFAIRWGFYTLPVLFEETSARNGLRRSTELVKGTWWRVFGITLGISVIALIVGFILQTSSSLILASLTGGIITEGVPFLETLSRLFTPMPPEVGWMYYIIYTISSTIIAGIVMPISIVGSALLYFDLRIRKEGFDIEMQVTK